MLPRSFKGLIEPALASRNLTQGSTPLDWPLVRCATVIITESAVASFGQPLPRQPTRSSIARTTPLEECTKPTEGLTLFYTDLDRDRIEVRLIDKMGRKVVDRMRSLSTTY